MVSKNIQDAFDIFTENAVRAMSEMSGQDRTLYELERDEEMVMLAGNPLPERM